MNKQERDEYRKEVREGDFEEWDKASIAWLLDRVDELEEEVQRRVAELEAKLVAIRREVDVLPARELLGDGKWYSRHTDVMAVFARHGITKQPT